MRKVFVGIIVLSLTIVSFSSCVSSKKYKELMSKRESIENENNDLKAENRVLKTENNELNAKVDKLSKEMKSLKDEHADLEKKYSRLQENYNNVNTQYKSLLDKNQELLSGSKAEAEKILVKLNQAQTALMAREDSLDVLEKEYSKRKQMLDELSKELNQARIDIQEKEKAYNDLQRELARKDSIMTSLKNSVAEALVGFENQGINIRKENGRVYVSMDEKLLFASGSFNINVQGQEIIKKLSVALQDNQDISILVEGHTDSIPYGGRGQLVDNWDLSVKRSTTIVREMISNSNIDPKSITAAGRSKYLPVATNETKEGRSANRRTEIILMPNLSKLESIINE
jgi:chemotaxis protein MotB